jgi:hypothetical protein
MLKSVRFRTQDIETDRPEPWSPTAEEEKQQSARPVDGLNEADIKTNITYECSRYYETSDVDKRQNG